MAIFVLYKSSCLIWELQLSPCARAHPQARLLPCSPLDGASGVPGLWPRYQHQPRTPVQPPRAPHISGAGSIPGTKRLTKSLLRLGPDFFFFLIFCPCLKIHLRLLCYPSSSLCQTEHKGLSCSVLFPEIHQINQVISQRVLNLM